MIMNWLRALLLTFTLIVVGWLAASYALGPSDSRVPMCILSAHDKARVDLDSGPKTEVLRERALNQLSKLVDALAAAYGAFETWTVSSQRVELLTPRSEVPFPELVSTMILHLRTWGENEGRIIAGHSWSNPKRARVSTTLLAAIVTIGEAASLIMTPAMNDFDTIQSLQFEAARRTGLTASRRADACADHKSYQIALAAAPGLQPVFPRLLFSGDPDLTFLDGDVVHAIHAKQLPCNVERAVVVEMAVRTVIEFFSRALEADGVFDRDSRAAAQEAVELYYATK